MTEKQRHFSSLLESHRAKVEDYYVIILYCSFLRFKTDTLVYPSTRVTNFEDNSLCLARFIHNKVLILSIEIISACLAHVNVHASTLCCPLFTGEMPSSLLRLSSSFFFLLLKRGQRVWGILYHWRVLHWILRV